LPEEAATSEADFPPIAIWRKILWVLCAAIITIPIVWALVVVSTVAYQIVFHSSRSPGITAVIVLASIVAVFCTLLLARTGLRRY
jgi:NO-binding membrane sensor protein with MHYT domain